jgi:hypothetical protein
LAAKSKPCLRFGPTGRSFQILHLNLSLHKLMNAQTKIFPIHCRILHFSEVMLLKSCENFDMVLTIPTMLVLSMIFLTEQLFTLTEHHLTKRHLTKNLNHHLTEN